MRKKRLLAIMLWLPILLIGCESQGQKQIAAMKELFQPVQKAATDTQQAVKGNANQLQTITDNHQEMFTSIHKTIEQNQLQYQKSAAATAEQIGTLIQNTNNTQNSSWMVFGIIIGSMAINAALIIMVIKTKVKISRAIRADDNTLTKEQFRNY